MNDKSKIPVRYFPPSVLIPWPTGVIYEAQINGLACYHDLLEGECLPLPQGLGAELSQLHPGCCVMIGREDEEFNDPNYLRPDGLTPLEADALDKLLEKYALPIRVKRATLKKSCEAWVHIYILPNHHRIFQEWGEQDGILTWDNCD